MEQVCIECGITFSPERKGKGRPKITCGEACRRARHAKRSLEARWAARGQSTIQESCCSRCGVVFTFTRSVGVLGRAPEFCSAKCRTERKRQRVRAATATHRERLGAEERARRRRIALLARYRLTPERYEQMVTDQGGVCKICRKSEGAHHSMLLKIDHDRSCCPRDSSCGRCIRGLLCSNCNRGIGLFGDDPATLRAAAIYLASALTGR